MAFEENEVSKNANGGTEIAKRKLAQIIDPKLLENVQIICSRPRELQEDKIRIMWFHDLPYDPEVAVFKDKNFRDKFHKFIFISNWQFQQYINVLGFEYSNKCLVLESGIEPISVDWVLKDKDKINVVYTSTPQRGLSILVPVFTKLCETYSNIHLDVYSSFKIYGWDDADKNFEPLYDQIRDHSQMTYHGYTPHEDVLSALVNYHIHAYPCIWSETSCRAVIEAMSAGNMCIHPNFSALPDTSSGLNFMYPGDSDIVKHASIFYSELKNGIVKWTDHRDEVISYLKYVKNYADNRFNIDKVKYLWEEMLTQLNTQYSTVELRSFPKQVWSYKVA